MELLLVSGVIGVASFLYYLPSLIASTKDHHNAKPIFIMNLLLGWTGLGWVTALAWAATRGRPSSSPVSATAQDEQ